MGHRLNNFDELMSRFEAQPVENDDSSIVIIHKRRSDILDKCKADDKNSSSLSPSRSREAA